MFVSRRHQIYQYDLNLAIFRSGAGKPKSTKEIATTILQYPPSLKVCKSTPRYVDKNLEFVVDTSHLLHWKDVRSDMMSGLVHYGTKTILLAGDGDNLEQVKGTMTTGVSDIPTTTMIVPIFIKLLRQFTQEIR